MIPRRDGRCVVWYPCGVGYGYPLPVCWWCVGGVTTYLVRDGRRPSPTQTATVVNHRCVGSTLRGSFDPHLVPLGGPERRSQPGTHRKSATSFRGLVGPEKFLSWILK